MRRGRGSVQEVIRLRSTNAEVIRLIAQRAIEVRELAVAEECGTNKQHLKTSASGEFIGVAIGMAAG